MLHLHINLCVLCTACSGFQAIHNFYFQFPIIAQMPHWGVQMRLRIVCNLNSVLLWNFSWVLSGSVDAKIGVFGERWKTGD